MLIFQRLIANHLAESIKRLLCLSTLGYRISELKHKEGNRTFFSKVNSLLDLAENEGAFKFAVCYTNLLWSDLTKLDLTDVDTLVSDLYNKLPDYLRYKSKDIVEAEMKKVIISFA